jgi:hypothetical protein
VSEQGFVAPSRPVETMPPVVSPELPPLTQDQRSACLMAAKRLIDASISGDRVHLECARGYIRDL